MKITEKLEASVSVASVVDRYGIAKQTVSGMKRHKVILKQHAINFVVRNGYQKRKS